MLPADAQEDEISELLTVLEELGLIIASGSSDSEGQLNLRALRQSMFVSPYKFFTALSTMAPKGQPGYGIDMRRIFDLCDTDDDSVTDTTLPAILQLPLFTEPWTEKQRREFTVMNMGTILALIAAALDGVFEFENKRVRNPSRLTSGHAAVGFLLQHRQEIEVRAVRCWVRGPCTVEDVTVPGGC